MSMRASRCNCRRSSRLRQHPHVPEAAWRADAPNQVGLTSDKCRNQYITYLGSKEACKRLTGSLWTQGSLSPTSRGQLQQSLRVMRWRHTAQAWAQRGRGAPSHAWRECGGAPKSRDRNNSKHVGLQAKLSSNGCVHSSSCGGSCCTVVLSVAEWCLPKSQGMPGIPYSQHCAYNLPVNRQQRRQGNLLQVSANRSILGTSGFLAAFSLIFLSEIGDKTFFIAGLLAAKVGFRSLTILFRTCKLRQTCPEASTLKYRSESGRVLLDQHWHWQS